MWNVFKINSIVFLFILIIFKNNRTLSICLLVKRSCTAKIHFFYLKYILIRNTYNEHVNSLYLFFWRFRVFFLLFYHREFQLKNIFLDRSHADESIFGIIGKNYGIDICTLFGKCQIKIWRRSTILKLITKPI